ncbi:MAG: hypothetical protein ACRENN_07435, partial [Candidatus Eiseniibacteriota bacterium]
MRTLRAIGLAFLALVFSGLVSSAPVRAAEPADGFSAASTTAAMTASAIRLFGDIEDAWGSESADRLAALVDTTVVRIALKPGAPLTSAVTRGAAAFL